MGVNRYNFGDEIMGNEKFLNALSKVPQNGAPPIWFMRQAGRYHKHYQNLKLKYSFMELCKVPELACQVALGPIQDFDFDVAILFSDLLFPLESLGMGLEYGDGGPKLGWHLTSENIKDLKPIDEALPHLHFQKEAMTLTRRALPQNKSLIGFVGGPWTLFTYAVQGKHDGSLIESKKFFPLFTQFCETLVPLLVENIKLQLEGGAEVVMLFDTAAGEVSPSLYLSHIAPQIKKIAEKFPKRIGYYSKGTQNSFFEDKLFKENYFAGLGFDHRWNLPEVMKNQKTGFTQGNFDQALLFLEKSELEKYVHAYLKPFKEMSPLERAGWVCGLGHGVLPKTPEDNVKRFIEIVREGFK
jgi:uroporphyrinogen decarboxylase